MDVGRGDPTLVGVRVRVAVLVKAGLLVRVGVVVGGVPLRVRVGVAVKKMEFGSITAEVAEMPLLAWGQALRMNSTLPNQIRSDT